MSEAVKRKQKTEPTDDRTIGEWETRYPRCAWIQIILELAYLLILLIGVSLVLLLLGHYLSLSDKKQSTVLVSFCGLTSHKDLVHWLVVALSGAAGGLVFDLKWLYHAVARGLWSQDRVLWRVVVPINSAIVSVFLAFIVLSGLIPFVKADSFRTTYFGLGFGFLFGYFSDNVIAALQNFASKYIGTTKENAGDD